MSDNRRAPGAPDCIPVDEIGAVLERGADDPRRGHLEECPRCRAIATEYAAFLAAEPLPELADDVQRIDRALRAEILGGRPRVIRGPERWWTSWKPVLAAAAVLAVAIVSTRLLPPTQDVGEDIVLRGGSPADLFRATAAVTTVDGRGPAVRFLWSAEDAADSYRVELFDAGFATVGTFETGADTSWTWVPQEGDAARARDAVLWRVVALDGGDEIRSSTPAPLPWISEDGSAR